MDSGSIACKQDSRLIFLVSNKWQVDFAVNMKNILGESFSLEFIYEDEKMLGDSKYWIEKSGFFQSTSILELSAMPFKSKEVVNKLIYKKEKKVPKIFFLVFKDKGRSVRKIVNLSAYCNAQLIILQHGENFTINGLFNWKYGWYISNKFSALSSLKSIINLIFYKFVSHFEKKINCNRIPFILSRNSFYGYADVICTISKEEKFKIKSIFKFKLDVFNIGSIIRRNIAIKNKSSSFDFYDKVLFLTSGALKNNAEDALDFQIQSIKIVYAMCKKQNKDLIIKYKPAEKHRLELIKEAAPGAKLINDSGIYNMCRYRYLVLPADSGSCIEASYFRRRYLTYTVYKNSGHVAKVNKANNVINFFSLNQSEIKSKKLILTYFKKVDKNPFTSIDFFDNTSSGVDFEYFLSYLKNFNKKY